ncbi:MAG: sulfite exporter TauE/SafE family protein [Synechococcales bacterium]|nr:sulfite exporter TauE/SafE family protein [Synechococcales bacterium]
MFEPTAIAQPLSLLLLFGVGIVTGTLAGIFGIGGGLLIVPALTLWRVELVQATATSLVGVFISSLSGSWRNWSQRQLDYRMALVLAVCGLPTAQLGAWLAERVSESALALSFACFMLVVMHLMNLKQKVKELQVKEQEVKERETTATQPLPAIAPSLPSEKPRDWPVIALIGLLAGLLSGLFGVGGGTVMVPLQMIWLYEPIKSAVRTSLAAIVAIAASALIGYAMQGNVLWQPGIALGLGGSLGAQWGTRLLHQLPSQRVTQLFRLLLISLAIYMVSVSLS